MDATSLIYQRSGRIVLTGRRPSAVPPGAAVFLELSWSQGGKPSPGRARLEHRLVPHFGGYCYQGGPDPDPDDASLVPISVPELHRLLNRLRPDHPHPARFVLNWSRWRRRHQAVARDCHIKRRRRHLNQEGSL
jgi:hypothetical protein